MVSMLSVLPSAASDPGGVSITGIVISLGVGVTVWLVATFIISRITRRVASGSSLFKRPTFKWVAPALRALDHERRVQRAETIGSLLNSVVGVLVVIITGMYVLQNLDINIAPLLTSVGILGVAIGFGAQQLIRDFLAGIFITIEDQYGIGDVIETSEVVGVVESMGLRITRVRSDDGAIWYLRNGEILRVGNRSQGNYTPSHELPDGTTDQGSDQGAETKKTEQKAGD
ncbi:mechanosensitive ion channel family protein [Pseudarthrobacter sp. NamB4]|uniref:mechanosensitive ion channel family protein n=1 Tax=Pseudarthrobacter sp. NamB4 TaxID=2576837 RepID=UPI0010FEC72C|nr:mechanosensitive ion channel domain-containing protein [Pseudarthrobacter sp. NamB4]TLM72107.1 mechanosensitive ion channel [Pseudarthrobacter sp. NamB4]